MCLLGMYIVEVNVINTHVKFVVGFLYHNDVGKPCNTSDSLINSTLSSVVTSLLMKVFNVLL